MFQNKTGVRAVRSCIFKGVSGRRVKQGSPWVKLEGAWRGVCSTEMSGDEGGGGYFSAGQDALGDEDTGAGRKRNAERQLAAERDRRKAMKTKLQALRHPAVCADPNAGTQPR